MEESSLAKIARVLESLAKEPLDIKVGVAGYCSASIGVPRSSNPYIGEELEAAWYMGWDRYEKERQEGRRPFHGPHRS